MYTQMKEDLLSKLELLSPHLPTNTLDELIDGLGGTHCVAEMTGRRGRVVSLPGGRIQYQLRSENEVSTEMLNIREKQRFMDGEKVFDDTLPINHCSYSLCFPTSIENCHYF